MNNEVRSRLEFALKRVEKLPTIPTVYASLRHALASSETTAMDVAKIIQQDQSIAAKILRVVNSAFYGFPRRIDTISRAVVILGFNEIKNLTLSVSVIGAFKTNRPGALDLELFWEHALGVAVCADSIVRKSGRKGMENPDSAFIAGLLHDIGKLVSSICMTELFARICERSASAGIPVYRAEKEMTGFTHEDVGDLLADNWEFPSDIQSVIGFHHNPLAQQSNKQVFPLLCAVHATDAIVKAMGLGSGGDPYVPDVEDGCWDLFGLNSHQLEQIVFDTEKKTAEIIRDSEKATGKHTPVVALTAHALEGYKDLCFKAKMDGYLSKPVSKEKLLKELLRFCHSTKKVAADVVQSIDSSKAKNNDNNLIVEECPVDIKTLSEQLDNDQELISRLFSVFIREAPLLLTNIKAAFSEREY